MAVSRHWARKNLGATLVAAMRDITPRLLEMKKGYAIILLDVHDRDRYAEYARRATEIEDRHGGRPLVVSDTREVVEGEWPAERTVVLEFPSIDHVRAWYEDPDYQDLISLRHGATSSRILFVEGFLETD